MIATHDGFEFARDARCAIMIASCVSLITQTGSDGLASSNRARIPGTIPAISHRVRPEYVQVRVHRTFGAVVVAHNIFVFPRLTELADPYIVFVVTHVTEKGIN